MKRFNSTLRLETLEDRRVLSTLCASLDATPVTAKPIHIGDGHDTQTAAMSAGAVSGSAIHLGSVDKETAPLSSQPVTGYAIELGEKPHGANKLPLSASSISASAVNLDDDQTRPWYQTRPWGKQIEEMSASGVSGSAVNLAKPADKLSAPMSATSIGSSAVEMSTFEVTPVDPDQICIGDVDVEPLKPSKIPVGLSATPLSANSLFLPGGGWCGTPDLPYHQSFELTAEHVGAVATHLSNRPTGGIVIDPGLPSDINDPKVGGGLDASGVEGSALDLGNNNQMPVQPVNP